MTRSKKVEAEMHLIGSERLLLLALLSHKHPKVSELSNACGVSVRQVQKLLRRLSSKSLIDIVPRHLDGVQHANEYRLNLSKSEISTLVGFTAQPLSPSGKTASSTGFLDREQQDGEGCPAVHPGVNPRTGRGEPQFAGNHQDINNIYINKNNNKYYVRFGSEPDEHEVKLPSVPSTDQLLQNRDELEQLIKNLDLGCDLDTEAHYFVNYFEARINHNIVDWHARFKCWLIDNPSPRTRKSDSNGAKNQSAQTAEPSKPQTLATVIDFSTAKKLKNSKYQTQLEEPVSSKDKTYKDSRGNLLKGKMLECFERLWDAYDHKADRADTGYTKSTKSAAATAFRKNWDEIESNLDQVIQQACVEAHNRAILCSAEQWRKPKHLQGWITERRWENEAEMINEQQYLASRGQSNGKQQYIDPVDQVYYDALKEPVVLSAVGSNGSGYARSFSGNTQGGLCGFSDEPDFSCLQNTELQEYRQS